MAVRQCGQGWQCDFYAYKDRVRKVFSTKRDARAYEGKIKASIREGRFFDIKKEGFETFKELSEWYLGLPEVQAKRSFERDEGTVRTRLNPYFGTLPLRQITPSLINEYVSKRLEKGIRPATVNRELALFKSMFNKAIRDGKLEKNPSQGVKLLPEHNERDRILSPEEWERYKNHCPGWYLPVAMMAYQCAVRKGEIVNLSPSRVDLKEGFIRLRSEDTKTGEARSIPIHPELIEVLRQVLKVRPLNCNCVFHRDGKPITADQIRWIHELISRKAGIEGFVFHDFRHTCINNWRRDGHDYFKIMAASGHRTMSVFRRYNMVDEPELKTLVGSNQKVSDIAQNG